MALFEVPIRPGVETDKALAKKANSKAKKQTKVKSTGLYGQIEQIKLMVDRNLGQFRDEYQLITDRELLRSYLRECRGNGYISIDTETTGLNPLQNILAGICVYTYGQKGSYIPLNHVNYMTGERISSQLLQDDVIADFLELLHARPEIDMFNAPFDIRFLKAAGLQDAYCTWDGSLAARLLNENEPESQRGLKVLHNKYCLGGVGDAFSFDDLFNKVVFTNVPLQTAYLYAAHDPVITTELCDFQRQHLRPDSDRQDMQDLYWVFKNIEMPIVDVVVEMEDTGVAFDTEYNRQLSVKYNALLQDKLADFYTVCAPYEKAIAEYRRKHPDVKLDNPINIASPKQMEVLFYDIIGLEPMVDKRTKKPIRKTDEKTLTFFKNPVCEALLKYRELEKLVGTYIDKLPNCVDPADHRIHGKFNQYGADTGRFSSSDPNLQNIPSHNKDIRQMFVASAGCVLLSSDFSQQEPKCLAALCRKDGDSQMYETFMQGKDLYSEIASASFHRPYEDCLEFYLDENGKKTDKTNKEGKEYRSRAKSILLGVLYGRGTASVAEQLGCTTDEAQAIKDSVFQGFPAIKKFENDSLRMAKEIGYVTTVCGRKRRLVNLQLPEYEFQWMAGYSNLYDDPLDFTSVSDDEVPEEWCEYFWNKLMNCTFKQRQKIYEEANAKGVDIINNTGKISEATRQCVNARIQGSAADLTKLAMVELYRNQRLRELGFRMLIQVHDEIIAECPEENAKECARLLAETMSKAAEQILEMPIKCDVTCSKAWYGEEISL